MIAIARDVVRKFRTVARKCLAGRPLGPAPPVVCRVRAGTLMLWTRIDSVGLRFAAPTDQRDAVLVVPMAAFAAIEGPGTDVVTLSCDRKLQGTATWSDRGVPQTHLFTALMPGKQHAIPDLPVGMSPVTPEFLIALHECGKTAARDSGRFVLNHVQIRGKAGQVIATDAKQALVLGGFAFPFERDILVPAIPAFGCRELAEEAEIRVGHSATELIVACGPWSVWLPVNAEGRYPDVASILPKPGTGTAARLDDSIAAELLRLLPALPGAKDEGQPVTIDLEADLVVRGSDEATGLVREHALPASVAGPGKSTAVDRSVLVRALALGCRTIRIHPVMNSVIFEGPNRTLVVAALDAASIVPRPDSARRPPANPTAVPPALPPILERSVPVKSPETNGTSANGKHEPPPLTEDGLDPLAEAEALRLAVAEVGTRLGRLIAALRSSRKEKKVLANVWAGLKQLNLGGGAQ
ncbi:MAG TPA: hypothetical protein VN641_08695 [Urbifossiella sp.]|nr:hypothetical protein [Urbifossiella sp.]